MIEIQARRLASVHPGLAGSFLTVSQDFVEAFPGCRLIVADGYRTAAKQQQAAASGRSNADGTRRLSYHQNYPSLALDFAVLDEAGKYVTDGADPRYRWVGEQFEQHGYGWGGRWKKPDWDHVEVPGPGPADAAASYALYRRLAEAAPTLALI